MTIICLMFFISHILLVAVWISTATQMTMVSSVARISEEVLLTWFLLLRDTMAQITCTFTKVTGALFRNHNWRSPFSVYCQIIIYFQDTIPVFTTSGLSSACFIIYAVQDIRKRYFKGEVIFLGGKNSFP